MPKQKIFITKEELEKYYIIEEKSMSEIANIFNCSSQTICNCIKKYNLPVRSSTVHSEKTKKKISESRIGNKNPMFGKKRPEHAEYMKNFMKNKFNKNKFNKNPVSEETRKKMSKAKNGLFAGKYIGDTHPKWISPEKRKSPLYKQIRDSTKMKQWRLNVFTRDNYTCQNCFVRGSITLNADHIKQFALIIKENNIKTLEEALYCQELWELDNGRTLCNNCHKKTETFAKHINN